MSLSSPKKKKRVAFLSSKLTLRGTEVAVYDYADCNETMLGNESIILTRTYEDTKDEDDSSGEAHVHFRQRFQHNLVYYAHLSEIDDILTQRHVDVLYIIKSGRFTDDRLLTNVCRCVVHAVFESDQPHGDAFAVVGSGVNERNQTNCRVVPHMVRVHPTKEDLRMELGIPKEALVFGCYGGYTSFDIYRVMKYIHFCTVPDVYFMFMNIKKFSDNPRVLFLPASPDMEHKRKFINTCDAMIHGRARGETFGLACGEFALAGKPVITCGLSVERTHLHILGRHALLYSNDVELDFIVRNFRTLSRRINMKGTNPYASFTPEKVMTAFDEVFLQNSA